MPGINFIKNPGRVKILNIHSKQQNVFKIQEVFVLNRVKLFNIKENLEKLKINFIQLISHNL